MWIEIFNLLDRNGDGFVDEAEAKVTENRTNLPIIATMMEADKAGNGDHKCSKSEWENIWDDYVRTQGFATQGTTDGMKQLVLSLSKMRQK